MARAVYSTQLLQLDGDPQPSGSFTVPAGLVAVVRDIVIWCGAAASGEYSEVWGPSGSSILVSTYPATGYVLEHWTGRQVFTEGQSIGVASNASGPGSVLVSGYLLSAS